jgi:hypothetical protein
MLADETLATARTWIERALASGAKFSDDNPPELGTPRTREDLAREAWWMARQARIAYFRMAPHEHEHVRTAHPPDPDADVAKRLLMRWAAAYSDVWWTLKPGVDYPIGTSFNLIDDAFKASDIVLKLEAAVDALLAEVTAQ